MDTTILKAEVTDRLGGALASEDPVTELTELSNQLIRQINRVDQTIVKILSGEIGALAIDIENDPPDDEGDHIWSPFPGPR